MSKADEILAIVKHFVEIAGGADKALEMANKTVVPRKYKRAHKFLKRSFRILSRIEKGLPVKVKGGMSI